MRTRLKAARLSRGITLRQLALQSGFGVSTINNFENGRTEASPALIKKLSQLLGIPETDLIEDGVGGVGNGHGNGGGEGPWRRVPVVSWARAGAACDYGDLCNQIDEWVEAETRDANAFALIIEGDSMEPEFYAGDQVVISPNSEPRNRDYVACRLKEGHGVMFKLFRRTGPEGRTIRLESLNPVYRELEIPQEEFRFIYPAISMKRRLR